MGIRISEMEEATTFGADDYVPIVTSGTNKKALGQKIKDFIAGFFATKTGDNITDAAAFRQNIGAGLERRTRQDITSRLTSLSNAASEQDLSKYNYTIGDYFTGASGYTYTIADMDTFYGGFNNDATVNTHHIVLVVDTKTNSKWNNSNDTSGGYSNSVLQSFLVSTALNSIKNDFVSLFGGSTGFEHLIGHKKILTTGTASWAWTSSNAYISALTEIQVYGATVWSLNGNQTGEACKPLNLFQKYSFREIYGNKSVWLRDIVSSTNASNANNSGFAATNGASNSFGAVGLVLFH